MSAKANIQDNQKKKRKAMVVGGVAKLSFNYAKGERDREDKPSILSISYSLSLSTACYVRLPRALLKFKYATARVRVRPQAGGAAAPGRSTVVSTPPDIFA